jgi:hypothetical protein
MARTTDAAVREIIELDASFNTAPMIEVANRLVTRVAEPNEDYEAEDLELGERWLAAHFCAVRDARPDSEKAGSISAKYQYKVDLNLAVTVYGQQAMVILPELASLSAAAGSDGASPIGGVSITWLGKDPQVPAEEED